MWCLRGGVDGWHLVQLAGWTALFLGMADVVREIVGEEGQQMRINLAHLI